MLLVILCLLLSVLLYFRGRWMDRMRREEQRRQPPPPPPPPAYEQQHPPAEDADPPPNVQDWEMALLH